MKSLLLLFTLFFSLSTFAHPGHGMHNGHSWLHYLIEHYYLAIISLTIAGLILGLKARNKQKKADNTDNSTV